MIVDGDKNRIYHLLYFEGNESKMDNRPIGMFDSGVGGMTVFRELISTLSNENVIYIGDTASFPYGSKSKETIVELSKKQVENLIQAGVKLIVVACGTATSQALEELQKMFDIPIIGIIKPTVQYLKQKQFSKIGVIATTGTIRSRGWEKAIKKDIDKCVIQNRACPLLAPMAEEGWINNKIAELTIHEYIKDFDNIETLILGCTHYPLFKDLIAKELPEGIEVINTGKMVSNAVQEYLKKYSMENENNNQPTYQIYLTDTECNFIEVTKQLIKDENIVKNIKKI